MAFLKVRTVSRRTGCRFHTILQTIAICKMSLSEYKIRESINEPNAEIAVKQARGVTAVTQLPDFLSNFGN